MTIKELLEFGIKELNNYDIKDSRLKAKILLAFYLDVKKEFLISHDDMEVDENVKYNFINGIEKLKKNFPIQYITNYQEFMKLKFYVDENVLIPRDDTEILVQEVLDKSNSKDKILDLCTGSGAIGVSIKKYKSDAKVYASDISLNALNVAKKNAEINNVDIIFLNSNLFENIKEYNFDIIVSNPPYISKKEMAELELQVKKEPEIALYGGIDGLDFYKKIISEAKKYLKINGFLMVEIGYNQKENVEKIFHDNGYSNVVSKKDLYGNDRIVIGCYR